MTRLLFLFLVFPTVLRECSTAQTLSKEPISGLTQGQEEKGDHADSPIWRPLLQEEEEEGGGEEGGDSPIWRSFTQQQQDDDDRNVDIIPSLALSRPHLDPRRAVGLLGPDDDNDDNDDDDDSPIGRSLTQQQQQQQEEEEDNNNNNDNGDIIPSLTLSRPRRSVSLLLGPDDDDDDTPIGRSLTQQQQQQQQQHQEEEEDDYNNISSSSSSNNGGGNITPSPASSRPRPDPRCAVSLLLGPDGSISASQLQLHRPDPSLIIDDNNDLDSGDGGKNEKEDNEINGKAMGGSYDKGTTAILDLEEKMRRFPICPTTMQDYVPCKESFSGDILCQEEALCIIAMPSSYSRPIRWPESELKVRASNFHGVPLLRGSGFDWVRQGDKFFWFLPQVPTFTKGADMYVDCLAQLLPDLEWGRKTRIVLDLTGGTGNLAAALAKRGAITMTIASHNSSQNGVQLILERGYPALLQNLKNHRLPYPSQAFDLIHCVNSKTACFRNGSVLFEVDRLVRAGGFIVLKGNGSLDYLHGSLEHVTSLLCWEIAVKNNNLTVWRKPMQKRCNFKDFPPVSTFCNSSVPPNAAWQVPLIHCHLDRTEASKTVMTKDWPERLTSFPLRLDDVPVAGIKKAKLEAYTADLNYWKYLTDFYVASFGESRVADIHNVLDMNAGFGGFAAALQFKTPQIPWWVLNVVPITEPDRLPIIFDRGLLGVYHDWCLPLDTYPRTFDMIHVSGVFAKEQRCNVSVIALEMDRLLRPGGFALIRENIEVLQNLRAIFQGLRWKTSVHDTESGPHGMDKLLHCQKTFWNPKNQNGT